MRTVLDPVELGAQHAGSVIASRWGHSVFRVPFNDRSRPGRSVWRAGRGCCAMATMAMNWRVPVAIICRPLSETANRIRADPVVGVRVDPTRGGSGQGILKQALGFQRDGEPGLDLGRGLLRRHQVGEPLA